MNLHETIPPPLRKFSIASGRATFHVPEEFDLELSIADQDPSSQFYFIDLRLAFSPAPAKLPSGRLRDEIEGRANDILKREGLTGCFDFLHNLILTHKLSILRSQAFEMARGQWSDHLKVEAVHRSLVVQYWPCKPGGKNWIELGIKCRTKSTASRNQASHEIPHIALRWFRSGREVSDTQFKVETGNLSLQRILKQVIAAHTNSILQTINAKVGEGLLYSERLLKLKLVESAADSRDASLLIQLAPSRAAKLVQEPVTGMFALLPASSLYYCAEREMNTLSNPATKADSQLAHLRSIISQQEVEFYAHGVGWEELKSLYREPEMMRRLFPVDTQKITFYRRSTWGSDWALAFTTSMMGDFWWIVKLERRRPAVGIGRSGLNLPLENGLALKAAYKMPMVGFASLMADASYTALAEVESIAVDMISKYVDTNLLNHDKIKHKFGVPSPNAPGTGSPVLHLHLSITRSPEMLRSRSLVSPPWLNEIITLAYQGLDPVTRFAVHTASARLKNPIPNIRSLTSAVDDSIAFHPTSGAFAFRLFSSVGESSIPPLIRRLSSIERLVYFLSGIKQYRLSCSAISLNHLEFVYDSSPRLLTAKIHFPADAPVRIFFDTENPHLRIQDFMTSLLRSPDGLSQVVKTLRVTLPLLRALWHVEASASSAQVHITSHSAEWYQLRYENPSGSFDIRLRSRRDDVMWHVRNLAKERGGEPIEPMANEMQSLERGSGEGWRGMRGGMVASTSGVEDLIRRIDEAHRMARLEPSKADVSGPRGKKRKAEDELVVLD